MKMPKWRRDKFRYIGASKAMIFTGSLECVIYVLWVQFQGMYVAPTFMCLSCNPSVYVHTDIDVKEAAEERSVENHASHPGSDMISDWNIYYLLQDMLPCIIAID